MMLTIAMNITWVICRRYTTIHENHPWYKPRNEIENQSVFLLGDFNVDLLNHDCHAATSEFHDSVSSRTFLPHIVQPTRVSSNPKTLMVNVFCNILSPGFCFRKSYCHNFWPSSTSHHYF